MPVVAVLMMSKPFSSSSAPTVSYCDVAMVRALSRFFAVTVVLSTFVVGSSSSCCAVAVSTTLRGFVCDTVAVARSGIDGVRPDLSHSKLLILPETYFFGAAWDARPSVVQPSPKYASLEQMQAPPGWHTAPMSLPSTRGVESGPSEAFSSMPLLRQSACVRHPDSKVMSYIMPFCLKMGAGTNLVLGSKSDSTNV